MILKVFGCVAFFAGVKASSFCIMVIIKELFHYASGREQTKRQEAAK